MDKIEKIRQEIEQQRRYASDTKYPKGSIENERATAIVAVCLDLLAFIDTLAEEPSESLEEEIQEYMSNEDNNPFDWDWRDKRDCARHFAEWGAKHLKK